MGGGDAQRGRGFVVRGAGLDAGGFQRGQHLGE
jgi:hypothetical protein